MKALIIAAAALVAVTSFTLGSIPASAKSGCDNKRSVAVSKDQDIQDARVECRTKLKLKAAATYGFDYWLKDYHAACSELGYPNNPDSDSLYGYWQCICSAYLCGAPIKLQLPPQSPFPFKQKREREPAFEPSPGRYLDMPNLGRLPGMGSGISPSRPRR